MLLHNHVHFIYGLLVKGEGDYKEELSCTYIILYSSLALKLSSLKSENASIYEKSEKSWL
jgi:hypothetical protein